MKVKNEMKLQLKSRSVNEGYARMAVSAFACELDPNVEELNDIKTAVSEAVTNCIVHAYNNELGTIYITVKLLENSTVEIKIRDRGCGIEDVKQAMTPLFTTLGGDRSGLGFSVMESFSDSLKVTSKKGKGTTVTIVKRIKGKASF
ncbi:MAG: anti-sigma F factor [Clostridia bacterium]|nr:anti-sigma F factor [Clostridia bacterium]